MIGTSSSPGSAERLRALGAKPIKLDLLDARAVRKAVLERAPDAIVHEATALANVTLLRNFDKAFAQTNRLRTEGTDALLAAAREAGVDRFVAQSFASMRYAREGGLVKTEDDPLDPDPAGVARDPRGDAPPRRGRDRRRRDACATAASTAPTTTDWSSRSASASSRSSATAAAPCRSSTWTTPPRRRCSPSSTTARRSTTSSTTSLPRCANGCP